MKDYSLKNNDLKVLRNAHRRTRIKRDADRIKAVYLLGSGWALKDVSEALLIDENTARSYAKRYKKGKIPGLLNDDYLAYEGKLLESELSLLDQHLSETTYRRAKDIIAYIEHEFDVTYTSRGVTELLHRLGYSYKKPRRVPGKADTEKQMAFIEQYKKLRKNMAQNDKLLFLDGVHPHHNPLVMCGWIKRGQEKNIKTNTRYHRLNILGALDIDSHEMVTQFSNVLNAESALDFLEKIRKKYKTERIHLVVDNAGYFTAPRFQEYAAAIGINLIYLPPYSPNLNIIERVWLYFQKNILYNKYYPTFKQFTHACKRFFRYFKKYRDDMASLLTENFEIVVT